MSGFRLDENPRAHARIRQDSIDFVRRCLRDRLVSLPKELDAVLAEAFDRHIDVVDEWRRQTAASCIESEQERQLRKAVRG